MPATGYQVTKYGPYVDPSGIWHPYSGDVYQYVCPSAYYPQEFVKRAKEREDNPQVDFRI